MGKPWPVDYAHPSGNRGSRGEAKMFVPGRFSLFSPLRSQHPFFDGEEDPPASDPPKDPPKSETKTKTVPLGAVVFESQGKLDEVIRDRVERAKEAAALEAKEAEAKEQGDFRKIVEEQYSPLKARVEKELEPELETWRKSAEDEIKVLEADLSDDLKDLMPEGMSLQGKLVWLRKAIRKSSSGKPKDGNSPKDPDPKSTAREQNREKLRERMALNPIYRG